jgi:hypothetical protein
MLRARRIKNHGKDDHKQSEDNSVIRNPGGCVSSLFHHEGSGAMPRAWYAAKGNKIYMK